MSQWRALGQLILARLREFIREPAAVFWVYGFPLVMIIALGLAFPSRPVEKIKVAIQQGDTSSSLQETLESSDRFRVQVLAADEAQAALRTGNVEVVVSEANDSTAVVTYQFDPSRPGSLLARNAVDDLLQRAAGRVDVLPSRDVEIQEPGSRYVDFLVPGLIGLSLMGGGMWGVGFAIVDLRIRKLLKRFLATPMKRSHFLAGMMISRMIFLLPEFVVLLVFARLVFGVQSHGGYVPVAVLILLGSVEFSGIGLLVASRASTIETVSGLMNLVMLPMWIFGGIFFSADHYPAWMQPVIQCLPLTPLISALRSVMLEGASLLDILPEMGIVALWGGVTFAVALWLFRWK